jgi:hypothetical protein
MEVLKMKQLKLKNAVLESLTENKVIFIGELKGYIQRLSYTITNERYNDLLQLDENTKYNIWQYDGFFHFKPQKI